MVLHMQNLRLLSLWHCTWCQASLWILLLQTVIGTHALRGRTSWLSWPRGGQGRCRPSCRVSPRHWPSPRSRLHTIHKMKLNRLYRENMSQFFLWISRWSKWETSNNIMRLIYTLIQGNLVPGKAYLAWGASSTNPTLQSGVHFQNIFSLNSTNFLAKHECIRKFRLWWMHLERRKSKIDRYEGGFKNFERICIKIKEPYLGRGKSGLWYHNH